MLVSRNEETLREICEELTEIGHRADYVVADVGERDEVARVVDVVVERHGGFDTWVNNAGIGLYGALEEISDEDHERLFKTNYWGVVYGSLEALRHLRERGGTLINVGSISSDMPSPILSAYTASKHAVKGFTNSLRLELIHEKAPVSVTLIKPSGIQTPFGDHARNYMDAASRVPPPVYHPRLVADAILAAAETPTREIMVGGSGVMQTSFARTLPHLADRFFAWAFYKLARDESRPPQQESSLFTPGGDGRRLGEQGGMVRKTSLATAAQINPGGVLLTAAAAAMAALALLRAVRPGRHH